MGDDVGAGLVADPAGAAEVVGVAVGDDDGVHPAQRDAGARPAARSSVFSVRRPGSPGSTMADAALVLEHVAVDVAEAGHVDRQLGPQHARGDLGDLARRPLLLLAAGAVGVAPSAKYGTRPARRSAIRTVDAVATDQRTSSRILPTLALDSMWRWASATSSSGNRRSITGRRRPS